MPGRTIFPGLLRASIVYLHKTQFDWTFSYYFSSEVVFCQKLAWTAPVTTFGTMTTRWGLNKRCCWKFSLRGKFLFVASLISMLQLRILILTFNALCSRSSYFWSKSEMWSRCDRNVFDRQADKKRDISAFFLSFYFFSVQSQRPGHYRVDVILCKIDKMSKKDDWEGKKKEGATPRVRPKMDSLPSFSLSHTHTHANSLSRTHTHTHTRSRRETRSREKECEAFG